MAQWWTVVGTLGGVLVTAAVGLVTAMLTHRWQQERLHLEQRFAAERELRTTRREVYVRYLVTAQRLFDVANSRYQQRKTAPEDPANVVAKPPEELRGPLTDNEAVRVEAMLLAASPLREALASYDRALWDLWPRMASGTDRAGQSQCTQLYHRLVQAMHDEIHDNRPPPAESDRRPSIAAT